MVSPQTLDFEKAKANKNVTVSIGPLSAIANLDMPTAAELNAMRPASQSISWNDFDFGMQASEQTSDPSLADAANYQSRGAANYGGAVSIYVPEVLGDASNNHALVHEMMRVPHTSLIVAVRIDGETPTTAPFANGDYVSLYVVKTDAETNVFTGEDDYRRTIGLLQQGIFAFYTVVGPHVITATPTTVNGSAASATTGRGRITATVGGRNYTNALKYRSSNAAVVDVRPGGFYKIKGAGSATITISDPGAGTTATVTVTGTA